MYKRQIWGRGMAKIIPILLGVAVSYAAALLTGAADLSGIGSEPVIGLPDFTLMKFDISAIITIMPIALATMMEHIGDISAIGATKMCIRDRSRHVSVGYLDQHSVLEKGRCV